MKKSLVVLLAFLAVSTLWSANPPAHVRTVKDLKGFPLGALKDKLSRPFYRSIEISPVDAWVVAKADVFSSHTASAHIVHPDGDGVWDKFLLERANNYSVTGNNTIESRLQNDSLFLHLLVFKTADGYLAICFPYFDDARYAGYFQGGNAWVGLLKNGKWTRISKPDQPRR